MQWVALPHTCIDGLHIAGDEPCVHRAADGGAVDLQRLQLARQQLHQAIHALQPTGAG